MLILTEKPSVAAAFAQALGVEKKDRHWENENYCIVNALGHLLKNFDPDDYDPALNKWSLDSLPIIPDTIRFKAVEKTKAQLDLVKSCFARHRDDPFLLATDAEREGELIGAEILDYAGFTRYQSARRFWVSAALTKDVILDGIRNAKPLADYASYKDQGFARQAADWLTGMNITRLISLRSGRTLHFGRVQSAVLAAVYEREMAIKNFIPQKYAELTAVLAAGNASDRTLPLKLVNPENAEFPFRFPLNAPGLKKFAELKNSMTSGAITALQKNKKVVRPPRLFNLTALQKKAGAKFSYSPEQTLAVAQALYEKHKCLSYPRTPSSVMAEENAPLARDIYDRLSRVYPEFSKDSDPALISPDNKRVFNTKELEDHHALIPLIPLPDNASTEESNVFSLVLKQFFTVFKPDYIYNAVSVTADISGFAFSGNAVEVVQYGWKAGHENEDETDAASGEDQGTVLDPAFKAGNDYGLSSLTAAEKLTEPPKHYSFVSILQLMENPRADDRKRLAGLGTPATRGSILKTLFDRGYLLLKAKNILISGDGVFLIENIKKNPPLAAFISIAETTRWEEKLHSDTARFLEEIKDFIRLAVADTSVETYRDEKKSLGQCPLCGAPVYEGKKNYYCAAYKQGCQFVIWKEICQAPVGVQDARTLLTGKITKLKKCRNKAGKNFDAAFYLKDGKVELSFPDKKK
jgi:DNA topoisomerase-3